MIKDFKKLFRFTKIYGLSRALIKAISRLRLSISLPNFKSKRNISIIGCGQFGFSTISYFLYYNSRGNFLDCYDIDSKKSETLRTFYGFKRSVNDCSEIFDNDDCELVYISSNHSTHTSYAIKALKRNLNVYIEKPISVTFSQLEDLLDSYKKSKGNIYVGYNRPFSKAVKKLKPLFTNNPFTINFILLFKINF